MESKDFTKQSDPLIPTPIPPKKDIPLSELLPIFEEFYPATESSSSSMWKPFLKAIEKVRSFFYDG